MIRYHMHQYPLQGVEGVEYADDISFTDASVLIRVFVTLYRLDLLNE